MQALLADLIAAHRRGHDAMESVQTETPIKLAAMAECAHAGCTCTLEPGAEYCSDYCAAQAGMGDASDDDGCGCGHPECEHTG